MPDRGDALSARRAPATPGSGRRVVRTTGLVVAVVAAILVVAAAGARPAAAETPAGDTESFVTRVEPPSSAFTIRVLGGDETLRIDVVPGHEVVVLGYAGEPYLRIDPQGEVFENRRSPAVTANADRYSSTAPAPDADPEAEPAWTPVGSGGSHEWHDHRMHWMAESIPAPGEPGDLVFAWTVELAVDGTPVAVTGELRRGPASTPWPFVLVAAAALAAAVVVGRRRPVATVAVAAGVVTLVAIGLTVAQRVALECWSCGRVVDVVPVLIATVATVAMVVVRGAGRRVIAATTALVALTGWLLVHAQVLTEAVVVSALPTAIVRGGVAAAIGSAAGALWVAGCYGRRALDEYASTPPSQRGRGRGRARRAAPVTAAAAPTPTDRSGG